MHIARTLAFDAGSALLARPLTRRPRRQRNRRVAGWKRLQAMAGSWPVVREGPDGYWIYEPAEPTPKTCAGGVFPHGCCSLRAPIPLTDTW